MKPLLTIIGLGIMLSFSSCFISDEGPIGPQGPQGNQGPQGPQGEPGEEAYVFDYENVSFTGPDYEVILPYDASFTALDTDVTLVYFLWGTEEVDGNIVEIWRPLPQTILTENGILQYNFDYTIYDVKLFMDANYSLDMTTAIDTDNWVVRIVVVPAQYWAGGKTMTPSFETVAKRYNLKNLTNYNTTDTRR